MGQQLPGAPCVFARYETRGAKCIERAWRQIAEVSNWCCDDVQHSARIISESAARRMTVMV